MQINRNNYEIFFLDYWENILEEQGRIALAKFLELNPDLQNEFLDFKETSTITLNPENKIEFFAKDKLKHTEVSPTNTINADNYEDHFIAHFEGDLSAEEEKELEAFIQMNPKLKKDLTLYKRTFLVADQEIKFDNKAQIKRALFFQMPPKILFYTSAIAAMLLLVFAIYNPFGKLQKTDNLDIAVVENPIPEKTDIIKDDHIAPVSAEEGSVAEQIIFKKDNEPANAGSADKEPPVLAQQNVVQVYAETSSLGPSFRDLAKVEQIVVTEKTPVINTSSIARFEIPERVEISQVFDDMLLRDEIREENAAQESKSVFGRILANIGNQIFGLDEIEGEKPSLLAGMLQDGKERFTEIAENSPLYEATQDDGSKGKYFAINENFSIRISKGDKNRTNSE